MITNILPQRTGNVLHWTRIFSVCQLLFSQRPLDETCYPEWSPELLLSSFWKIIRPHRGRPQTIAQTHRKSPDFLFGPCSFIFTGFGHPVKILRSCNRIYRLGLWPFVKMVRKSLPSGLHSGLSVTDRKAILTDRWIVTFVRHWDQTRFFMLYHRGEMQYNSYITAKY